MRTKIDPLKWPILDAAGNPVFSESSDIANPSQNEVILSASESSDFCPAARPLPTIPIPPVPRVLQSNHIVSTVGRVSESESVSSSVGDSLNPDVPEFIPNELTNKNNEAVAPKSNNEPSKTEEQSEEVKSIPASSNNDDSETISSSESSKMSTTVKCSSPTQASEVQINGDSQSGDNVWKEVNSFSYIFSVTLNN